MRYYGPDDNKLLKCGVITIDENDKILNMTEKSFNPATHWCCPPFYYYTKEDAKLVQKGIHSGCGTDAPGSLLHGYARKLKFTRWRCPEAVMTLEI